MHFVLQTSICIPGTYLDVSNRLTLMKKITKIVDSYERHRLASVILSILLVASVASVAFTQNASDNLWADAQAPPNVQGVWWCLGICP